MPALILYLLKVNVAIVLFYLAYHFVLRRLTFYALNRCFLLFGIVFSTAYPFIDVSGLMSQHQDLASAYITTVPVWVTTPALPEQTPAFDYWQIPVFVFWLGTGAMAIRLLLQFISLYKIHAASEPTGYMGICFRRVNNITQAFSFWQAIYLNPVQHKAAELESILRHEQVHVKGWHTLDVLLAELNTVFYWFNPGAWLMKKATKENLEFIADQEVICAGVDRKAYQYLLLKVVGAPEPQIANQFNFPSLKRRIAMMNKKQSSLMHVARYAVLVPLIAAPILLVACSEEEADSMSPVFTAGTATEQHEISVEEEIPDVHIYVPDASTAPEDYKAFLKRNPEVRHISWESNEQQDGIKSVIIHLKSGGSEVYDLNDEGSMATVERKYGELPTLPPPPPPYRSDIPVYIPNASNIHEGHSAFLKRNPEVKQLGWMIGDSFGRKARMLVVYLKSGEKETYDLDHGYSVEMAENKYGELPNLPPPPPPVKQARKYSPPVIRKDQKEELPYIPDEANQTEEYKIFLKRNPEVKQVGWTLRNEGENKMRFIHLYLQSGTSEVYNLYDKNNVAIAERKYGKLPPPPPVRNDDK